MFSNKTRPPRFLNTAALLVWLGAAPIWAAEGGLDPTFDADGIATLQMSVSDRDQVQDVLVLLDRSVLVAGSAWYSPTDADFAVAKLGPDGKLDESFGAGGSRTIAFDLGGGGADYGMAIARQADGKLVVAGYAETPQPGDFDLGVARLHADGSLDMSFGIGGKVTVGIDLGGSDMDVATDVLIQPDGRIVLAGFAERAAFDSDFVAVRLLADGSLDTSFAVQGRAVVSFNLGGVRRDQAHAAVLQSDGKIVLVGSAEWGGYDFDFAAARLLPNGSLDTSFGSGGRRTVSFDLGGLNQDYAEAVTMDRFGRIVLAGRAAGTTSLSHDFAVARLLADGSLDPSFASGGRVTVGIDQGLGVDHAYAVSAAPRDALVVAGLTYRTSTDSDFAAVRLRADGSLDPGFGSSGRTVVPLDIGGDLADKAYAMAVDIGGGIVLAGPAADWGRVLTGVVRLEGAPWFSIP